jgi:hypothetical protein
MHDQRRFHGQRESQKRGEFVQKARPATKSEPAAKNTLGLDEEVKDDKERTQNDKDERRTHGAARNAAESAGEGRGDRFETGFFARTAEGTNGSVARHISAHLANGILKPSGCLIAFARQAPPRLQKAGVP